MASAKPKPATNGLGSVEVDGLQRWGEVAPTAMEADPSEALLLDDMATSPFVMNEELNFRIALWQGDVTTLKVDAVVNCNNDDLNERSGVSGQLFVAAGPQLEEACTRLGGCQPGQAKATRGFKLPAKHVIHTVPPPWLDGREAEATLERCYESSLRAAAQLQCATVAVTCIKTKDAPREQVAHAALRTALLTAQPTLGRQPSAALAGLTQPPRMAPRPGSPSRLGGSVGDRGAAHAASAATTAAVASVAGADEAMRRGSAYASFLERAGLADLSDIDAMELFYRAGVDARGRPIFLFWAGHLPARPIDRERVLMHIMRTLDRYVQSAYIIVYIHTTLSPENEPPFAWLRKVYELFDRRLKDNLYLMYIVHASWWLKMAMNFLRTFAGNGRFWETKVIQLPCLADLFKRNYFAPGTLRMPDSPLVRKYLEMSNDVHLLDAVMGDDAATRHAKADALAAAVSAGALPGGRLGPGASPTEQAAVALAAAERASTDGHGGAAGGAGSIASQKLAQAQASKEILLKQLIEISDQLAYSRAASDAVEQRLGSVQAAKDQEINRLSNALFEAHRDVDEARRKLEQVHQHTVTMEDEKSERRDALAELADLEGQLAHAQVYNHYMAKELLNLQKTIKADRWEMLYEISSLERQLEAAKARRTLEHAHPPKNGHSSSLANGHAGTHAAEGEEEAEAVLRDELGLPIVSTEASRLEELAQLQATLAAQRTEVARAMEAMAREQIELGAALKQAAEEAASTRGAEQARAAQAEKRQHELQAATKELEEKISAIKAAAKLGAERAVEQSSVAELSALEAIVLAAEEDIGRIEQRLAEPAGDGLTDLELLELQASLKRRKEALEEEARLEPALARIASRKDAAMAEVASQLVPHMNTLQRAHEEQRATAEARLQLPTISDAERSALVGLLNQQAAAHEAELADLEARAAQALASLEDRFEQEAERASAEAKAAALEKMRVEARLDGVNARLAGIAAGGALSKVRADKVALMRRIDEQQSMLESSSRAGGASSARREGA
ncbi:RNA-directed RNA polymerase [Chrysochromulina tobinii]|uniref:RNA-directed RNA polymerase n=1 Tax=Chrysochromulina tobinii TaxID=1460289 RepID=A0A0M0JHD3_9EUKA|nr:RNA-directed RNA polymerase [Chrysochromulina tobinii]|eukprot:KOO25969.1 RNA-directed RNA polymerase [Chrysochromulina sp. CCMP291]